MKKLLLIITLAANNATAQPENWFVNSVSVHHMVGFYVDQRREKVHAYNEDNHGWGFEFCEDDGCLVLGTYTDSFKSPEAYFAYRKTFDKLGPIKYGLTGGVFTHSLIQGAWPLVLPTFCVEYGRAGVNLYVLPVATFLQVKVKF